MAKSNSVANKMPQVNKKKYKCVCCGQEYSNQETNFYQSNSVLTKGNNNRMFVCKKCIVDLYAYLVDNHEDSKVSLYFLCRWLDIYFDSNLYTSVEQEARNTNKNTCTTYITKVNSLPQYTGLTFSDSTTIDGKKENPSVVMKDKIENKNSWNEDDVKNKEDVIRMVGYDPFENDNTTDQKYLYNTLVDFLDESTLEDSFKLPMVIEIVKSFNQLDKINQALSNITSDINNVQSNSGGIKSLIETKDKLYKAILAMAKDNGISVNHSNNKSKGAGTLSGIIKQLQEKGFTEAEVNLFDVETAKGMQQVAELSNSAIVKQLMLDENDMSWLINEQRTLIQEKTQKLERLEEEVRLLKINIKGTT